MSLHNQIFIKRHKCDILNSLKKVKKKSPYLPHAVMHSIHISLRLIFNFKINYILFIYAYLYLKKNREVFIPCDILILIFN
jgi:hypothetical protein